MPKNKMLMALLGMSLLGLSAFSADARADYWEFSTGFNYTRSTYPGGSYSWNRRLGGSLGYNFSDSSTIEVAYQKSFQRTHYQGFEDSFATDQVFSLNMVWNVLGRSSPFQPYFKVGIGQLNRDAFIIDSIGRTRTEELDQITGVLGAGLKLHMTKATAIRIEATSYLSGAKIQTWHDNFGATFGISLYY